MLDIDDFSRAVAGVYDASMNVERWLDAQSCFAPMFGAGAARIDGRASLGDIAFLRIWGVARPGLPAPRRRERAAPEG